MSFCYTLFFVKYFDARVFAFLPMELSSLHNGLFLLFDSASNMFWVHATLTVPKGHSISHNFTMFNRGYCTYGQGICDFESVLLSCESP
jgi:hypothetical protein